MRAKTAVVLGAQWGDEGKGKIVDVLSERFSAVARYAGGHNAGHTVIIGGQKFVLQLIPCGVLRPGAGASSATAWCWTRSHFLKEVAKLRALGVAVDEQLFVSNRAQVILPYHRMIELAAESAPGRKKIGTTSRGIGPAYEDKMARSGLRVVDLLRPELLKTHIEAACAEKNAIARALFGTGSAGPGEDVRRVCGGGGAGAAVCDRHGALLNKILAEGGSVMFEGAQGTMLDIDHGTYPFVTSSSATAGGAATGTGVGPTAIGTVIAVTKAYVTRVGEGPFPTEIHDAAGDHAAGARQRVRRGDRAAAALRLAGHSAAALLQPGERRRVAGGDQAGRAGRAGGDSHLRGLRDRRQGDGRDSRRRAGPGADQAGVYHAEGLAELDRGDYGV
jgi:adenylosuccinate synthase